METVIEAHRNDARYSFEIGRTEVVEEAYPNNALFKLKDLESPKPTNCGLPRL